MADIEGLCPAAIAVWILLCHEWDFAERGNHPTEENKKGWVYLSQKTLRRYNLKRAAYNTALRTLKDNEMIIIRKSKNKAARIKMRETRLAP